MKNQISKTIAIFGLFFMLAITSINAQAQRRVEVKIPFDFTAGKTEFKAGTYTIKHITNTALVIRSIDGETTKLVDAPLAIDSRGSDAGQRVVFNQYGGQYFLSQVWLTADSGRQLFTSSAEEKAANDYKLANKDAKPARVQIAASR